MSSYYLKNIVPFILFNNFSLHTNSFIIINIYIIINFLFFPAIMNERFSHSNNCEEMNFFCYFDIRNKQV